MLLIKLNDGSIKDAPLNAPIAIVDADWSGGDVPPNHTVFPDEQAMNDYKNSLPVEPAINKDAYVAAVQRWLDSQAQSKGYDDIATAVTYAEEPAVLRFQVEGKKYRALRSLVWDYCYSLLASPPNPIPTPSELVIDIGNRFSAYIP